MWLCGCRVLWNVGRKGRCPIPEGWPTLAGGRRPLRPTGLLRTPPPGFSQPAEHPGGTSGVPEQNRAMRQTDNRTGDLSSCPPWWPGARHERIARLSHCGLTRIGRSCGLFSAEAVGCTCTGPFFISSRQTGGFGLMIGLHEGHRSGIRGCPHAQKASALGTGPWVGGMRGGGGCRDLGNLVLDLSGSMGA